MPQVAETAEVIVRPASLRLRAGETRQVVAQANDAERKPIGGADIAFASATPGLLKVTPEGLITSLGPIGGGVVSVTSGAATATLPVAVVAGPPEAVIASSPTEQSGTVGQLLPAPLEVLVTDGNRNPARGAVVEFLLTSSGGAIDPERTATDSDGIARTMWTLGPRVGRQVVTARLDGQPETGITLSAVARAGAVAALAPLTTVSNLAAGTEQPLRVQARDAFDNPVANVELVWTATSGELAGAKTTSDESGIAQTTWKATATGTHEVRVSASGRSALASTFAVAVFSGPAAQIKAATSEPQSGRAGQQARVTPAVRVVDAYGNPVVNALVSFAVTAGGGSVDPASVTTDDNGQATARWTFGSDKAQTVEASVDGAPKTVRFEATVRGGRRP